MSLLPIALAVGVVIVITVLVLSGIGILAMLLGRKPARRSSPAAAGKPAPSSVLDDVDNSPFFEVAEDRRKRLIHDACRGAVDKVVQDMHPGLAPKPPEAKP